MPNPKTNREKQEAAKRKNRVYKCPQSAFLAIWFSVHKEEGTLDDLVDAVREQFDGRQEDVMGVFPEFTRDKCKQKCDRIIERAEKLAMTNKSVNVPTRLPGHADLASELAVFDW